jgi:uncharacterized protein DUF892
MATPDGAGPIFSKAVRDEGQAAAGRAIGVIEHRGSAKRQSEIETHVSRLEQVFDAIDAKPQGKTCDAILGIIEEGFLAEGRGRIFRRASVRSIRNAAPGSRSA